MWSSCPSVRLKRAVACVAGRGVGQDRVHSDPSCTNFILVRFADRSEAEACDDHLKTQGLIVRRVAGYNLPNALRITVGDEQACRRVVAAITAFKEGAA